MLKILKAFGFGDRAEFQDIDAKRQLSGGIAYGAVYPKIWR